MALTPEWFPDWRGEVCAVVASGQSSTTTEVEKCRGRCRVAVVNNNFQLAPWANVLYAADSKWWETYPDALAFQGIKATPSWSAAHANKALRHVAIRDEADPEAHRFCFAGPLGHFGNGGTQLINLVLQFGCRRVILIGFDMRGEHWHAPHKQPLRNPRMQTLEKWRQRLDAQAGLLVQIGVRVVNASETSALQAYDKMPVDAALEHFGR